MNELRSFELYLMGLMRGRAKIDSTLRSIGISASTMREAARRMSSAVGFLDLVARPLDSYIRILGTPRETIPEPGIGPDGAFDGSQRHRFPVPLWPNFDLILRTHPDGWVWGPEFVRRSGASVPAVKHARNLEPWSIVESEVITRFGPFASADSWNLGKDATYVVEEADGRLEIALVFDLALLQSVHVAFINPNPPPLSPASPR